MGCVTYAPPLDINGNSVKGIKFLKRLSDQFCLHHFDNIDIETKYNNSSYNSEITNNNDSNENNYEKYITNIYTLMNYAASGDIGGVKRIYNKGLSLDVNDYDKRTALHIAVENEHVSIVQYLIDLLPKSYVLAKDRWGNTAYSIAEKKKNEILISILKDFI